MNSGCRAGSKAVVGGADRVEVLAEVVVGERFDQHERAPRREVVVDMGARTGRITHVVQAVEEADQVVVAIERRRGGRLEADPAGKAGVRGPLACGVDRTLVGVEADDAGGRVGLGEQQCRRAVPAADVGDPSAGR
jgi:hypothetical protein